MYIVHLRILCSYVFSECGQIVIHTSISASSRHGSYRYRGSRGGRSGLGGLGALLGLGLLANLDLDGDGLNLFQELIALIQNAAAGITADVQPDDLADTLTGLR